MGKKDLAWRNEFNLLPINCNTIGQWGIRTKLKKKPFPPLLTSLLAFLHPPPEWCRKMWNGGCSQFITLCLCQSFLIMLFPFSSVGSLPWDTIFHNFLQHGSFPRAPVLHELLQYGSFPHGAKFRNRLLQSGFPMESQVLTTGHAPVWFPLQKALYRDTTFLESWLPKAQSDNLPFTF